MAERRPRETSAQIERDIETRRADMADTLGALQDRVAPGQWADAAGSVARHEGAALSKAVLRRIRAQPVAAALVAGGLAWLLLSGPQSGPRRRPPRRALPRRRPLAPPPA